MKRNLLGIFTFSVACLTAGTSRAEILADWRFGEAFAGYVDQAADPDFDYVPNFPTPVIPSVDSSGHASRDLLRLRTDYPGYNSRNQVSYQNLAVGVPVFGFVGPATYYDVYSSADYRGIYSGNDNSDRLSTRAANSFSNADFAGGYTLEAIFRPAIGPAFAPYQAFNRDGGGNVYYSDNVDNVLVSVEDTLILGYRDLDPAAGSVSPGIYFSHYLHPNGSSVSTPLTIASLTNDSSHFYSVVAIYDPVAGGKMSLYLDGVLSATQTPAVAPGPDTYGLPESLFSFPTVAGVPAGGRSAHAFIDEIRFNQGANYSPTFWLIPEPSVMVFSIVAASLARLRSRRR